MPVAIIDVAVIARDVASVWSEIDCSVLHVGINALDFLARWEVEAHVGVAMFENVTLGDIACERKDIALIGFEDTVLWITIYIFIVSSFGYGGVFDLSPIGRTICPATVLGTLCTVVVLYDIVLAVFAKAEDFGDTHIKWEGNPIVEALPFGFGGAG